jgi:hypothetical protein
MQILKRTGIDWRERRFISKLYMDQRVKVRLDQAETRSVKIGRGVRQGNCLSPTLFNLYSKCLTKEALDGLGDFNIGTLKPLVALRVTANALQVMDNMRKKMLRLGDCTCRVTCRMTYESESIKIKECYLMLATCVR